jgi:hypothetical protein
MIEIVKDLQPTVRLVGVMQNKTPVESYSIDDYSNSIATKASFRKIFYYKYV